MGPAEVKIVLSLGGWLSHGQSCHISYFYISGYYSFTFIYMYKVYISLLCLHYVNVTKLNNISHLLAQELDCQVSDTSLDRPL